MGCAPQTAAAPSAPRRPRRAASVCPNNTPNARNELSTWDVSSKVDKHGGILIQCALFGKRREQPREDLLRLKAALRRERHATAFSVIAIGGTIAIAVGGRAQGGAAVKQRGPRGLRVDE
jgi:hypothetical protein